MAHNYQIQTLGSLIKEEKLQTVEHNIVQNTLNGVGKLERSRSSVLPRLRSPTWRSPRWMHCSLRPIATPRKDAGTTCSYYSCTTPVLARMKRHKCVSVIFNSHTRPIEIIRTCRSTAKAISSASVHCGHIRQASSPYRSGGEPQPNTSF